MDDPGLAGRVALVTGANHGIGAAIVRELATRGARVVATYLRMNSAELDGDHYPAAYAQARAASADAVVAQVQADGGAAIGVETDLRAPAAAADLFDAAESKFGPIEILVNNASAWRADTFVPHLADRFDRPHSPITAASYDHVFGVDARASALLIAEFASRHVARTATWGRIIGVGSGGPNGFPGEVSYGAAKAAMESFTLSAAQELWPFGVTANVILPPAVDTGWITPETHAAIEANTSNATLGRRVATTNDIAEVLCLLASHQARFITGQVIPIR